MAKNGACVANDEVDQYRVMREAKSLAITIHHYFYSAARIPRARRWVIWNPSRDATFVLNVDVCHYVESRCKKVEGLLRTRDGEWVASFTGFLGDTSVLQAELVVMCYGLDLTWDQGVHCIRCFSDSILPTHLM